MRAQEITIDGSVPLVELSKTDSGIHKELKDKEWVDFADQIVCTGRQNKFDIYSKQNFKIGLNSAPNRLCYIEKKIDLIDLNMSYQSYEKKMKTQLLLFE